MPGRQIFGREEELFRIESFLGGGTTARTLVLDGDAGAGKSTLWDAGIEVARRLGLRVLSARPSGSEAKLSFAALTTC